MGGWGGNNQAGSGSQQGGFGGGGGGTGRCGVVKQEEVVDILAVESEPAQIITYKRGTTCGGNYVISSASNRTYSGLRNAGESGFVTITKL